MLLRICFLFCTVLVVQIQGIPGTDQTTLSSSLTESSSETTKSDISSTETSLKSTSKTTVNAPLVFPQKDFITLNKTSEKLPSNITAKINNNKTTPVTESNEINIQSSTTSNINQSLSYSTTTSKPQENVTHLFSSIRPTDTEVSDLENVPTKKLSEEDLRPVSPQINYSISNIPDKTVVLIDNGENTEDQIRAQKSVFQEPHVALVQGQLAAILAGVFLCVSIVGYVAMLSWRRYLENRYGNREMLVNEFEFDEREDMKYFSI